MDYLSKRPTNGGQIMDKKIVLAGCIILDNKNRVLLIHRNTTNRVQWETPGGKIDEGEDPEQTAQREIEEEIGVSVEIIRELGRKEFEEDQYTMEYIWFLAKVQRGIPKIVEKDKYDGIKYFQWKELEHMKLMLSPNTQNLVDAYFAGKVTL